MITAREIVSRIKEQVGCDWAEETIDTFKAGDPDAAVTGVATTFLATFDVLRRAQAAGLNFVITHEPTFYHHHEDTSALGDDPVLAAKRAFLDGHGLVVWRFHDHWHRRKPDGITEGMAEALGWQACEGDAPIYTVPETTVGELAADAAERLDAHRVRIVGDASLRVTRIGLCPGAAPSVWHYKLLQRDDVEVLVAGEAREWETVEYVRDAAAMGMKKALILLGHAPSEEAGMRHMAQWLAGFVDEVPVEFVTAGDPFASLAPAGTP